MVITGASSGIGRAAACLFAREGSKLILAARGESDLREVAQQCGRLGAEALAVPTDVRSEEEVQALATAAAGRFGGIDVWVNNAGVMAYGRFLDIPPDVFRAVIETNFIGQVHGARSALPHFLEQRSGVLINMSSVWGRVTAPDVSAYVASKFAVRALSESLRQELRFFPDVNVATMLPQAVDTPIFARAAHYAGRTPRPIPPLVDPQVVARGILLCAQKPKREVTYSRLGRGLEMAQALLPTLWSRLLPPSFEAGNYSEQAAAPGPGRVLEPRAALHDVYGGWKRERRGELRRALLAAVAGSARGLLPAARQPGRRPSP